MALVKETILKGPAIIDNADFSDLIDIMTRLRSPDGCPWDREQTHDSIKGHLIEETYEVIDAIENRDFSELKEELGDLLLQIVFHSQMADEAGLFSIDDVINEIVLKLKRRHPHVFGDAKVKNSDEVLLNWERIKKTEKNRSSHLSGVPDGLPALSFAQKLQEKAARVGFDWRQREEILDKLAEEIAEFTASEKGSREIEDEFGDILFTLVNFGRHLGIDAELALRRGDKKFRNRFEIMEKIAAENGKNFADLEINDKEKLWEQAKDKEKTI